MRASIHFRWVQGGLNRGHGDKPVGPRSVTYAEPGYHAISSFTRPPRDSSKNEVPDHAYRSPEDLGGPTWLHESRMCDIPNEL